MSFGRHSRLSDGLELNYMNIVSASRTELTISGGRLDRTRNYRVLMIAPTSFFADYGCHVRILEEARILQKLGHSVTIVTYRNGGPVSDLTIRRTLPIPWRQNY